MKVGLAIEIWHSIYYFCLLHSMVHPRAEVVESMNHRQAPQQSWWDDFYQ